jgi:hypothetical protein
VDVLVVAWVIYRALLVVRGTRAMQMAAGLVIVFLVYLGAKARSAWSRCTEPALVAALVGRPHRRRHLPERHPPRAHPHGRRAFFSSARERRRA